MKNKKNNLKMIIGAFLIVLTIGNMLFFALGKLEMIIFWVNLGILGLTAYLLNKF